MRTTRSPIRLLTVSNFFDSHRGGVEIVAGRLARELSQRGFEVTWLATDTPRPVQSPQVRAVGVKAGNHAERWFGVPFPLLGGSAIQHTVREMRRADILLLHDSPYMTSLVAFLAAKWLRKPVAIVQHIGEVPFRNPTLRVLMALANRCLAYPLLAGADQVIFISEFVRAFFARVPFQRTPALVFNGVDTDVFQPADDSSAASAREKLGLPSGRPVALFVGRFVEKKGLHLLRAMAAARPDITWALVGWGVLDPARWNLPNVRVYSGLSGDALADMYRASDLLVLPSRGEGFPLVIQEALACGLPVVCGAETTLADPLAASLMVGVPLAGVADGAAADAFVRSVDAVLRRATRRGEAQWDRYRFIRERYAWSTAAEAYAGHLHGIAARSSFETRRRVTSDQPSMLSS